MNIECHRRFNPPFSQSISTNIGQKFLNLVDSCFPPDHELRKVVNRNTIKISYSTMRNSVGQHDAADQPTHR